jgi:hypothetical protein
MGDDVDPLAPARGCIIGTLIGLAMWVLSAGVVYLLAFR